MKYEKFMNILGSFALLFFFVFLMNCLVDVFKADKQQMANDLISIQNHSRGIK